MKAMESLRSQKACAALVMILWLAALLSSWGIDAAGRRAIKDDKSCCPKNLQNKGVQLEMASSPNDVVRILNCDPSRPACVCRGRSVQLPDCDPKKAACVRRGVEAQVRADYLFIPAYSGLTLALFLFVSALRTPPSGKRSILQGALLIAGVLLALTMLGGDVFENRQLTPIIDLAGKAPPAKDLIQERLPLLQSAAYIKMGALALSAAVLGALWTSRSGSRLVWAPRLLGFITAALLGAGLVLESWQPASWGILAFAGFSFAGLIHAMAVAVGPEPTPGFETVSGGAMP